MESSVFKTRPWYKRSYLHRTSYAEIEFDWKGVDGIEYEEKVQKSQLAN